MERNVSIGNHWWLFFELFWKLFQLDLNFLLFIQFSSIYPPEHFKKKYEVDEVFYTDEVTLRMSLSILFGFYPLSQIFRF